MDRSKAISSIVRAINDKDNGNRIVPVLGSNCFYAINSQNQEVSIQQFVVESLFPDGIETESFSKCLLGFKGMSYLKRILDTDTASIRNYLYRYFTENKAYLNRIHLKKEVKDFVELGQFPLIIVTTTIPAIKLSPFSDLRLFIDNNENKGAQPYKAIYYRKEDKTAHDITINLETAKLSTPVLYHIFGSFITDDQCVLSENDFLDYLHCLHDSGKRPKKLYDYLGDKYLLMLGCEIPDWTFRFMLHSLKGNFNDTVKKANNPLLKEKFIGGNANDKMDDNLRDFLEDISYYSDSDIKLFLNDINQALDRRPDMFISYSANPKDPVQERNYWDIKEIRDKLNKRFHPRFYEDEPNVEKVGFKYWETIQSALEDSEYILYVITPNIIKRLKESSPKDFGPIRRDQSSDGKSGNIYEENGFITEWKLSLEIMNDDEFKGKALKEQFTYLIGVDLKEFQDCYMNCKNEDDVPIFEPLFAGKQCCMKMPRDFRAEELDLND